MADLAFARLFSEVSPNILHAFVSTQSQSSNVLLVSKNEWNAAHPAPDYEMGDFPGFFISPLVAGTTEIFATTNPPLGPTPTGAENRWQKRLQHASQIRIQVCIVQNVAAANLLLQYTTDLTGAAGWTNLGPTVSVAVIGNFVSAWATIPTPAKAVAGVLLRYVVTL